MEEKEKEEVKKKNGISFQRLLPFLTLEFKKELAKDIERIKKTFVLDSENGYETLHAVIKYNVEKEDKNNKIPNKKKSNFFWNKKDKE